MDRLCRAFSTAVQEKVGMVTDLEAGVRADVGSGVDDLSKYDLGSCLFFCTRYSFCVFFLPGTSSCRLIRNTAVGSSFFLSFFFSFFHDKVKIHRVLLVRSYVDEREPVPSFRSSF